MPTGARPVAAAPLTRRRFAALLAGAAIAPRAAFAEDARTAPPPRAPIAIDVNARPIASFDPRDRSHVRYGRLHFRSGLILTSPYRRFGGLSSLSLAEGGERFVSVSDRAEWFTGRLRYNAQREMIAVADVETAPLLDAEGGRLSKRGWYDSEAVAFDDRYAYVAFERVHQIARFDFRRDGVKARAELVATPSAMRKLPNNLGVEALAVAPKQHPTPGALIAISERGLDARGDILGFLIAPKGGGAFSIRRTQAFDIADAAILPDGDLLLLERKFSFFTGVAIRIRRIPIRKVLPGALLDGETLFDVDFGHEIDNMEGLAVHREADGVIVLTMVSDDNFSLLQRTLLLQFTLVED